MKAVKGILAIMCVFVGSLALQAATPKNYFYDIKEENGKIVSKTVFLHEQGVLNKEVMFEFAYNNDGRVVEKKACRWNKTKNVWEPFYLISYEYDETTGNFISNYGMWNSKKKDYSMNPQQMIITADNYDTIFS